MSLICQEYMAVVYYTTIQFKISYLVDEINIEVFLIIFFFGGVLQAIQ